MQRLRHPPKPFRQSYPGQEIAKAGVDFRKARRGN
jgi:hypothetical protein